MTLLTSIRELSVFLECHERTARRLVKQKRIPVLVERIVVHRHTRIWDTEMLMETKQKLRLRQKQKASWSGKVQKLRALDNLDVAHKPAKEQLRELFD